MDDALCHKQSPVDLCGPLGDNGVDPRPFDASRHGFERVGPLRDRIGLDHDMGCRQPIDRGLDDLDVAPETLDYRRDRLYPRPRRHGRTEQHLSTDATGCQHVTQSHRPAFKIRTAYMAAPKPESMLTTDTPGAQDDSIASSAAMPPNEAP